MREPRKLHCCLFGATENEPCYLKIYRNRIIRLLCWLERFDEKLCKHRLWYSICVHFLILFAHLLYFQQIKVIFFYLLEAHRRFAFNYHCSKCVHKKSNQYNENSWKTIARSMPLHLTTALRENLLIPINWTVNSNFSYTEKNLHHSRGPKRRIFFEMCAKLGRYGRRAQ